MTHAIPYHERYRPQFHFTARENWLNDPNGCVFHEGEYHLFFQNNPEGLEWGNMTWGHAVSPDLVHWRQLPHALLPYDGGTIFSGSAVVDAGNRSGFGDAQIKPLVAAFTHARKPFGQALAFSRDLGRTWSLYDNGRHIVPNQGLDDGERDPKIFWHALSRQWVMVLWVQRGRARFFTSDDLTHWRHASDFVGDGFYECPDLFELPVDGDARNRKWVLHDAAFHYWIGAFDGTAFVAEAGPLQGDYGANFYAAQTWNNTGDRVIQIGWMRGGSYPGMPFNQQMTFPCDLGLRSTPAGLRVCRTPVAEIQALYLDAHEFHDETLTAGRALSVATRGDLFDLRLDVALGQDGACSIRFHGLAITCTGAQLELPGRTVPLAAINGALRIRLLIDRASIELFANDGEVCISSCFLPVDTETGLQIVAEHGPIHIRSLVMHRLRSAWAADA